MEMPWLCQDQTLCEHARHHHVFDRLVRDDHDLYPRTQFMLPDTYHPLVHALYPNVCIVRLPQCDVNEA